MVILHCNCAAMGDEVEIQGEVSGSTELRLVLLKTLTRHELRAQARAAVNYKK